MRIKVLVFATLLLGTISTFNALASSKGETAVAPAAPLTSSVLCLDVTEGLHFLTLAVQNNGPDTIAKGSYLVFKLGIKYSAQVSDVTGKFLLDAPLQAGESRVLQPRDAKLGYYIMPSNYGPATCTASFLTLKINSKTRVITP